MNGSGGAGIKVGGNKLSDADIAKAYADQVRGLLKSVLDTVNQAKAVDSMTIQFAIVMTPEGKQALGALSVEKVTKLLG